MESHPKFLCQLSSRWITIHDELLTNWVSHLTALGLLVTIGVQVVRGILIVVSLHSCRDRSTDDFVGILPGLAVLAGKKSTKTRVLTENRPCIGQQQPILGML